MPYLAIVPHCLSIVSFLSTFALVYFLAYSVISILKKIITNRYINYVIEISNFERFQFF